MLWKENYIDIDINDYGHTDHDQPFNSVLSSPFYNVITKQKWRQ